jgi:hypothetical protein
MTVTVLPSFTSLRSSRLDAVGAVLEFESAQEEYEVRIQGGVLGTLLLALMARLRERGQSLGRTFEEQPLQLLDATALSLENGTTGLLIQLETDLRFPFALTPQAITNLKHALLEAEKLAASPNQSAKH